MPDKSLITLSSGNGTKNQEGSEIWVVETGPTHWECRKCRLEALDGTKTAGLPSSKALVLHMKAHKKAGHTGPDRVLWLIGRCEGCRGKGVTKTEKVQRNVAQPNAAGVVTIEETVCTGCKGDGLNELGREHRA